MLFRTSYLLPALLLASSTTNAVHVIFGGTQPVVRTRLDPIVNPGQVSEHAHDVFGGSGFGATYDSDAAVKSQCTTTIIPQDKSNYWVPSGYYVNPNGTFTLMSSSMNIYYLIRPGADNDTVHPFPAGLRMLAGDNERGTYNASNEADQAISYMCLDYNNDHTNDPDWAEREDFFDHQCPDGLRAQAFFPSCWDGQNLDSSDHKSHMAYPIGAYNTGLCPDSHPVHLISLFFEYFMPTGDYDYHGPGSWSFSNGDQVGLRFHADFTNGWADLSLLQDLIDNCPNALGNTADCPALAAVQDANAAAACQFDGQIVNEDIGLQGPIAVLPGCNLPWDGNGTMPSCDNLQTPGFVNAIEPLPSGWTEIGCIAEGTSGRALTNATIQGNNMTKALCSATCANLAFSYAGTEFGDQCYCGNALMNGASQTTISAETCNTRCAANTVETCGGPNVLALMFNPNPSPVTLSSIAAVPSPTSGPSASATSGPAASTTNGDWTAAGCSQDGSSRALTGYSFASSSMTPALCQNACADRGFSVAGLEYGSECYCGTSFSNSLGGPIAAAQCSMSCSGDSSSTCGGPWALSVFKQPNGPTRRSRHWLNVRD